MRIRRGYLFWGIVLVLLGAIPLAERAGMVQPGLLGDVARFWPVVLIVLGLAIVITRTSIGLIGTVVAALVVGGLAGGALAVTSDWSLGLGDCAGGASSPTERTEHSGPFETPGRVELELACGSLDLQAGAVTGTLATWALDARHRDAPPAIVDATGLLRVTSPRAFARQDWTLFVPGPALKELVLQANAASVDVDVTGGALEEMDLELNAADARVLAADASIARLDLDANAARVQLVVGGPATLVIKANASAIDLCLPPTAALEVTVDEGFVLATNLEGRGLERTGDTWRREGVGAPVVVTIRGNASSFNLDPSDGCTEGSPA